MSRLRSITCALAIGALALLDSRAAVPADATVTVKVIAINDTHGYLEAGQTYPAPDPADPTDPKKNVRVPVGGMAYLATAIARLRAQNPRNILVGAGDMVGASPLSSGLFHDEPEIEALDRLGLALSAVGNHEFDAGKAELLRKAHGGCRADGTAGVDTCLTGSFRGATFQYLAANVIDESTGKTLFPPYKIERFDAGGGKHVAIAFVGVVLKDTPADTTAFGVRGVHFLAEAPAINALLPGLAKQGIHAVVVLVHQGAFTTSTYDDHLCPGASGDLLPILDGLDPSIKLVLSGHTHVGWAHSVLERAGDEALARVLHASGIVHPDAQRPRRHARRRDGHDRARARRQPARHQRSHAESGGGCVPALAARSGNGGARGGALYHGYRTRWSIARSAGSTTWVKLSTRVVDEITGKRLLGRDDDGRRGRRRTPCSNGGRFGETRCGGDHQCRAACGPRLAARRRHLRRSAFSVRPVQRSARLRERSPAPRSMTCSTNSF